MCSTTLQTVWVLDQVPHCGPLPFSRKLPQWTATFPLSAYKTADAGSYQVTVSFSLLL